MLDRFYRDRRRAQAGTTLVELLVSITIMGVALVLIVGTLSSGLINATLAKRNTAAEAVVQYEMDKVGAAAYSSSSQPYSECFATENPEAPPYTAAYQASCPSGSYALRADVAWSAGPSATSQIWTITIVSLPSNVQVGSPVQVIKVNR
jgi:type II secretory pathway pseudopilin PulG